MGGGDGAEAPRAARRSPGGSISAGWFVRDVYPAPVGWGLVRCVRPFGDRAHHLSVTLGDRPGWWRM